VFQLLEKDAAKRIGTMGSPHGDIKATPFFRPIDWEKIERRELEPPYKPKLVNFIAKTDFFQNFFF